MGACNHGGVCFPGTCPGIDIDKLDPHRRVAAQVGYLVWLRVVANGFERKFKPPGGK